ncbi:MAG: tRNA uridine-5-carboxymethylaminomethyl(34) synthesis enzyme MnmG [Clostridiales bacterium]|nr:tRNA uridine-5-carboxymethylaminomethyl(34) synthesis enzyme MnmG [Clostridiales bacterium]
MTQRPYNEYEQDYRFDVVVIGGGHAAAEAALACARTGHKTCMLILNLESIGLLACNPSIGGTSKGHLVREIDALGGQMGIEADKSLIQLRMLNQSKGAAVQSLRAQIDKNRYHTNMKSTLENTPNLRLRQAEAVELIVENKKIIGVKTLLGQIYYAKAVIVATGVYLKSHIIIGDIIQKQGPSGFARVEYLSDSINKIGHATRRFKTGTPPRVNGKTIDYSKLEIQHGEPWYTFSVMSDSVEYDRAPCYLGYTNERTHQIIRQNIHLAPMYSGLIEGIGARYCPAIEDKVMRFADKERHQFFLEPEGLNTVEVYLQGLSTSLPLDIQEKIIRSIEGLENAQIMRDAYAIEYECIDPLTLKPSLESKFIDGLYFAGQINGTSGYEEAAAQGLMAGINASLKLRGKDPLVLRRDQAYIGVLIDDLTTKGTNEPYRMMTSRAEFRLHLRQDNADLRLTQIGYDVGLAAKERYQKYLDKLNQIQKLNSLLDKTFSPKIINPLLKKPLKSGVTLKELFKRDDLPLHQIAQLNELKDFSYDVIYQVSLDARYEGYIARMKRSIEEAKKLEEFKLPEDLDYNKLKGLRIEARQKLQKIRPLTLGQASRISGVNPADINVLLLYIKTKK